MARVALSEEIRALLVVFAAPQILIPFNKAENATTHEDMRMGIMIRLDLFQALICPIDAIPAINHNNVNLTRLKGMLN